MPTLDALYRTFRHAALLLLLFSALPVLKAGAQTHDFNLDFEDWHTDGFGKDRLDQWEHIGRNNDTLYQLHGTQRSTQRQSGNYAVTVHRWYIIDRDALRLRKAASQRPRFLNGFYTYTNAVLAKHLDSPSVPDIASVAAYFTKWNSALNRTDTIGAGYQELSGAGGFTPFSCEVRYRGSEQPDSVCIYIRPTTLSGVGCKFDPDCSFLTIDNLSFSDAASTAVTCALADRMRVYPNPAGKALFIRAAPAIVIRQLEIADVTGRVVMKLDGDARCIELAHLIPGHYFLDLYTNEGPVVKRFVAE